MAASHDFFISGDHEAARKVIAEALQSQGFAVSSTPENGFLAKRGSAGKTLLLGAMAGKSFQVSFVVDFMVDDQGRLVARLGRNMTSGALKGGVIGASRTNTVFEETANAIGAALTAQGVLADSISHA